MTDRRETPHVVHLVPALFGREGVYGGAERYVFELARCMAERVPTTLVAFGARDDAFKEGALQVKVLGGGIEVRGQRQNLISPRLVAELLRADVVHCHQRLLFSSLSAAWGRVFGRPVFLTDLGGGGWDLSGYLPTEKWFRAHLHISRYSQRVARHRSGVKSHVIYGGVDTGKFCPDAAVRRERAVLFVGRLLPHKGIDTLVKAMPPDVPLWIVGSEAHARYVEDLRALARGKAVEFLGGFEDEQVIERYRRATCCVLPSVYRTLYGDQTLVPELLGQTLLEAMACGSPVICTDVASMPEIVSQGVDGFIVPPNDERALRERLEWFVEHPAHAAELGEAARRSVLERFTWPSVVDRCLEAYREG